MKSLHDHYNITMSDAYYDEFCKMTKDEKVKVLEAIPTFNHLGPIEKNAEIKKILDGTPNTTTATKKVGKTNARSSRGGNAEDTAKRQGNDKPKD